MALALLMVARLAEGLVLPCPLSEAARRMRGAGARVWLSTLTLPAVMRLPLSRVVEATEHGNHGLVAETILAALELVQSVLDSPSRSELTDLIAALRER